MSDSLKLEKYYASNQTYKYMWKINFISMVFYIGNGHINLIQTLIINLRLKLVHFKIYYAFDTSE